MRVCIYAHAHGGAEFEGAPAPAPEMRHAGHGARAYGMVRVMNSRSRAGWPAACCARMEMELRAAGDVKTARRAPL